MELQLDLSKCNYCTLKEIQEGATKEGLDLATSVYRGGVIVHVNGERLCWLAKVPDGCTCEKDARDEDPFPPLRLSKDDTPTLKAIETVIDHFEEHVRDLQAQIDELKDKHNLHLDPWRGH